METKPQRRRVVVLRKSRTTDGKSTGSKRIIITEKTHKCTENGRHAAMIEIPERVYDECQVKLKEVTVKSYETTRLTLRIGGCL